MKKIFILAYARANLGDDLFVYMLLKKYISGIILLNNKLKKENISINEYLDLLKLELSVYSGREIENLSEARKILSKKQ